MTFPLLQRPVRKSAKAGLSVRAFEACVKFCVYAGGERVACSDVDMLKQI
jgi:hypothetical protein